MKAMERATHQRLLETLRRGWADTSPPFTVPASRYRDPASLAREAPAFRSPRIVCTSAALARGACLPVDVPGQSAIVVRDGDGAVHAFANACRHRATRLVDAPCAVKAFVCPYHGWTYDLAGSLVHVPHAEAFVGCEHRDLRALPVVEREGLVWLGADVDAFIGELGPDLAALGFDAMTTWQTSRVTRQCNWKLVVEAFLDGYHLRVLHRDSIYRFFVDAASLSEPVGAHIRAVSARRSLREAPADLASADLHALGTPSYVIFPATIIICHPDFVSLINLTPTAVDHTIVEHVMLVPATRLGEVEHWDKSWTLIDGGVLQREDLWVCEQIQRGLDDELLFGSLEAPIRWFHATLDRAISSP
jgi:phenylpropionate dioxygenase-like ring-hydroxylating dioxygenase large terminal subunit